MPLSTRRPINFAGLLADVRDAATLRGAGEVADVLARSLVRAAERLSTEGVGRANVSSSGDRPPDSRTRHIP